MGDEYLQDELRNKYCVKKCVNQGVCNSNARNKDECETLQSPFCEYTNFSIPKCVAR